MMSFLVSMTVRWVNPHLSKVAVRTLLFFLDLVALVLDIVDVDVKKLLGVADDVEESSEADMFGDCDVKVNDADGTSDVDHADGCAWTELSYANAMVW